jgi:hypothetical protein
MYLKMKIGVLFVLSKVKTFILLFVMLYSGM